MSPFYFARSTDFLSIFLNQYNIRSEHFLGKMSQPTESFQIPQQDSPQNISVNVSNVRKINQNGFSSSPTLYQLAPIIYTILLIISHVLIGLEIDH